MPSPVKKSAPLIKGQSSLSGFFSNGRLTLAESSNTTTPSPQKGEKAGSKEKGKISKEKAERKITSSKAGKGEYTGPPVQEVKEKVCCCSIAFIELQLTRITFFRHRSSSLVANLVHRNLRQTDVFIQGVYLVDTVIVRYSYLTLS